MNTSVDSYFINGCGRCPLGGTPECKVQSWQPELKKLRMIVNECGLHEECKWGVPCYTFQNSNVAIVSALKDYAALSFFKGSLLNDTHNVLVSPGENSQSSRLIKFTDVQEITKAEPILRAYIYEAIEVEKAGLKVTFKKIDEYKKPEELQLKLDADPALKMAFESLTPGRQRGYILHIAQPKQAKTREARVEKCIPLILSGKGLDDDYKARRK
ncbi:MAG: YdeI/OmpD-associated family protein [Flavobacteriales bacterium]